MWLNGQTLKVQVQSMHTETGNIGEHLPITAVSLQY